MAKIVSTLNKLLEGQLESDETLVSGVRVNLKGTAFGVGLSALGGVGVKDVLKDIIRTNSETVKHIQYK